MAERVCINKYIKTSSLIRQRPRLVGGVNQPQLNLKISPPGRSPGTGGHAYPALELKPGPWDGHRPAHLRHQLSPAPSAKHPAPLAAPAKGTACSNPSVQGSCSKPKQQINPPL